jgi:hypothetical protein
MALGISQPLGEIVHYLLGIVGICGHGSVVVLERLQIGELPAGRPVDQLRNQARLLG